MRIPHILGLAAAFVALSACSESPREEAAENVEANADARAENLEEAADAAPTEAVEANLENQADLVRNLGEESAEAVREGAGAETNTGE
ncbi:MAG: hypothetical protein M3438_04020 [Pseudomonadota bacterium]|nr:hypothetical protein [Sphingomonas sp.]MDQ3478308.1 hypothetical protein [Pseudomonadota bacterium]